MIPNLAVPKRRIKAGRPRPVDTIKMSSSKVVSDNAKEEFWAVVEDCLREFSCNESRNNSVWSMLSLDNSWRFFNTQALPASPAMNGRLRILSSSLAWNCHRHTGHFCYLLARGLVLLRGHTMPSRTTWPNCSVRGGISSARIAHTFPLTPSCSSFTKALRFDSSYSIVATIRPFSNMLSTVRPPYSWLRDSQNSWYGRFASQDERWVPAGELCR